MRSARCRSGSHAAVSPRTHVRSSTTGAGRGSCLSRQLNMSSPYRKQDRSLGSSPPKTYIEDARGPSRVRSGGYRSRLEGCVERDSSDTNDHAGVVVRGRLRDIESIDKLPADLVDDPADQAGGERDGAQSGVADGHVNAFLIRTVDMQGHVQRQRHDNELDAGLHLNSSAAGGVNDNVVDCRQGAESLGKTHRSSRQRGHLTVTQSDAHCHWLACALSLLGCSCNQTELLLRRGAGSGTGRDGGQTNEGHGCCVIKQPRSGHQGQAKKRESPEATATAATATAAAGWGRAHLADWRLVLAQSRTMTQGLCQGVHDPLCY